MKNPDSLKEIEHLANEIRHAIAALNVSMTKVLDDCESATDLARFFVIARNAREIYEPEDKLVGKLLNLLSNVRIPEAMEAEDIRVISFNELGRRVQIGTRTSCTIVAEDKNEAYEWLREHGAGELVIETVNSSTLSAFARTYMEEHLEELPEEIFKQSSMKYVSVVKT